MEYSTGKWGGTASYIPANMSDVEIIAMVTYAVENNHGLVPGENSLYHGFSPDGKIEIHFSFNLNGSGTFYPIMR